MKNDFQTDCIHFAETPENYLGAVTTPIFQNSLFVYPDYKTFSKALRNQSEIFLYTRGNNPTVRILEKKIAMLEKGEEAKCFGSGMAAISGAILSCVKAGDHIISVKNVYGPTFQFFSDYLPRYNISTSFISDFSIENLEKIVKPNTKLIYLESPSTFNFQILALRPIAEYAHKKGIATIIDNSWATPFFQTPIELGIDIVVHSCSKYLAGHSDVVAGVIIGRKDFLKSIFENEYALLGGILHPFEAWLLMRGIRTLPLRMERHFSNSLKIIEFLRNHPKIGIINYPLLSSHPQHELVKKQMTGGSGLFSFEIKARNEEDIINFSNSLAYFKFGVSWGGYESLVVPLSALGNDEKTRKHMSWLGLSENLIRISVGLENADVLISDLEQALSKIGNK